MPAACLAPTIANPHMTEAKHSQDPGKKKKLTFGGKLEEAANGKFF